MSADFITGFDELGRLIELRHPDDRYGMNWIEGRSPFGSWKCEYTNGFARGDTVTAGLCCSITTAETSRGTLAQSLTFKNISGYDLILSEGELGICTPFNDNYQDAPTCMTQRCHTHIFCGGRGSYVMALRMGGEAPHLGMVLTGGRIMSYSIERDPALWSNDRGDFYLHPERLHLKPDEEYTVSWELFWHSGKEDFYRKLNGYPTYIPINADRFVSLGDEPLEFTVLTHERPSVTQNGKAVSAEGCPGAWRVSEQPQDCGEYTWQVTTSTGESRVCMLSLSAIEELAGKRCGFITRRQQMHCTGSALDGAYLTYDNETDETVYIMPRADMNAARERVGMGVLIARYLQKHPDGEMHASLRKYLEFLRREIVMPDGTVCDDIRYRRSNNRIYNYPWVAQLYNEMYRLENDPAYLIEAYTVLKRMYEIGGAHFYAINVPITDTVTALREVGMGEKADELTVYFREHAKFIIDRGTDYPPHEVKYEQSIVAPAADILLQMYEVTGEDEYLAQAEKQLQVLALFSGLQPDHHLWHTAIRHWDGFWFGKRLRYGDTFPHYWSALSGRDYALAAKLTGCEKYRSMAEGSLRGVLSLFFPDGRASCAMVFPRSVNGEAAHEYDPWANDQDWGLYYMLRYSREN